MSSKRIFDICFASMLAGLLGLPVLVIGLLVKWTSRGPVLYWSDRVGIGNVLFRMPKFRTMYVGTPVLATHLLDDPGRYLTPVGSRLRKLSLDELPQLYSILKGDLSFVGPRPALYNQYDLIEMRKLLFIHTIMPGITGWAQVNGRDELPVPVKVAFDACYYENRSFAFDMKILFMTLIKVMRSEGIRH